MSENIPDNLREQLSHAGKKGIKKMSNEERAKGGRRSQRKIPHEERVRRGKLAWQARLQKARELAEKMTQEVKAV
ncbi:hypothetical protein KGP36_02780 [Patescibacteria group bacterium]|nr:hypothetical protein [Patescibacteria group bacterium]